MDTTGSLYLPPESSTMAGNVDAAFHLVLYVSIFFFILVVAIMAYFVIRFRRKEKPGLTSGTDHNLKLELLWTIVPSIFLLIFFVVGFRTYIKMNIVPAGAMQVKVTAQRWMWTFDYPDGTNSINELVVPVNTPVKVLLSSTDVIHSFYVPDFRVKMDVLPNRYTIAWFQAKNVGVHNLECAEYCGKGHSQMLGKVRVVSEEDYQKWLEQSSTANTSVPLEQLGEQLYKSKTCYTCHSIDGSKGVGPTFKGAFGHEVTLSDGSKVMVDENYVRRSILDPQAQVVMGFQPVMPTFQGRLQEREIDALIAFIKAQSK